MEVQAKHKNVRISPRKLRLLREAVRGLPVTEARSQLTFMSGKAADIILAVLNSAVANAKHNYEAQENSLIVSDVIIDGGYSLKRHNPVSRGMAHPILKRTAHVTVIVEETGSTTKKKRPAKKAEIETISAEQHIKEAQPSAEVGDDKEVRAPSQPTSKPKSAREKATTKVQMQQQGGDRKQAKRRVSKKDS